jgi:hypothetical protein
VPVAAATAAGISGERNKKWQMEMMMEKLRSKTGQYKTFLENAKALKMAMLVSLTILFHCIIEIAMIKKKCFILGQTISNGRN